VHFLLCFDFLCMLNFLVVVIVHVYVILLIFLLGILKWYQSMILASCGEVSKIMEVLDMHAQRWVNLRTLQ